MRWELDIEDFIRCLILVLNINHQYFWPGDLIHSFETDT